MSNYSAAAAAAAKNPPWQQHNMSMTNQGQTNMLNTNLLQYPQTTMLQAQLLQQQQTVNPLLQQQYSSQTSNSGYGTSMSMTNVSYPTHQLNATAFSNLPATSVPPVANPVQSGATGGGGNIPKQRVFTGTITKRQENFGFVDEDVFFQIDVCAKGSNPRVGDKVLVEASFNPSMPFKWNATRIQVLPMDQDRRDHRTFSRFSSTAQGPDIDRRRNDFRDNRRSFQRRSPDRKRKFENVRDHHRGSSTPRSSSPKKDDKKDDKEKKDFREKSRSRSRSPKRRRTRPTPRYAVSVPQFALNLSQADLLELRRRYHNMYIPSALFITSSTWLEAFPPDRPISLQHPCSFHILSKDVPNYFNNTAVLEPPDANYLFSAKVMLLSMPTLEQIFKRCVTLTEDMDKEYKDCVHPSRLINFLVGTKSKNETLAIGGPWSESLDGPNPESDPSVLIKTAIRTTKAMTGIDLSNCTQWFKFVELYYRRPEKNQKDQQIPARVETVVIYVPDVWNCVPTQLVWDGLQINYKKMFSKKISNQLNESASGGGGAAGVDADKDVSSDENVLVKREPTHYSLLDIKNMKVQELRQELDARSLPNKGLKSQLAARLAKALKSEQAADDVKGEMEDEEAEKEKDVAVKREDEDEEGDEDQDKKEFSDKDKQRLEKKYTLPDLASILVHPSTTAKGGKFNCEVMSLSVLLDYSIDDAKEHSFEVAYFAELFNEMLMRDFGFQIFKAIHIAPEKVKEEKEKTKTDDDDETKGKEQKNGSSTTENATKPVAEEENGHEDEAGDGAVSKADKNDDKKLCKDKGNKKAESDKDKREEREKRDKKKEKEKMYTANPFLLLCCVYFDTSHVGYMYDKDLENLMLTLGLSLSRAQVKKLAQKVLSRDNFYYRKLTDKPIVEGVEKTTNFEIKLDIEILKELIEGNRKYLPVFVDPASKTSSNKKTPTKGGDGQTSEGLIMYRGSYLDVGKIQSSLEKNEAARLATESALVKLRIEHAELDKSYQKLKEKYTKMSAELKDSTSQLTDTKKDLTQAVTKSNQLFNVISSVYKTTSIIYENPKYNKNFEEKQAADNSVAEKTEKSAATDKAEKDKILEEKAVQDKVVAAEQGIVEKEMKDELKEEEGKVANDNKAVENGVEEGEEDGDDKEEGKGEKAQVKDEPMETEEEKIEK